MEDRVSAYPGKVLITPESGVPFYATLTMADEPTQEGTPPTKANLLDDVTQLLIGLSDSEATVNMALRRLIIPEGKYAAIVTVLTPGERPAVGVTVTGITSASGAACVTDTNGTAVGFTSTASATLAASPNYVDTNNVSSAVTLAAGIANTVTLQLTRASTASKTFSSSTSVKFSPDVDTFDCSAIGGGGHGGSGDYYRGGSAHTMSKGGAGGAAGTVVNMAEIQNPLEAITVTIGAAGGTTKIGSFVTANGGSNGADASGASSFSGSAAIGGSGGAPGGNGCVNSDTYSGSYSPEYRIAPVAGSANSTAFLYPPTSVGGSGGGAGGFAALMSYNGANGGSPGGGKGAYASNAVAGSGPGAGGGGGAGVETSQPTLRAGASGSAGLAGMAWRYKS